jgi:hypothetical protein
MAKTQTVTDVAEIDFGATPSPEPPVVVAEPPAQLPATLAPEAATIFSIIERAARDQSVDIDKMERLISMQERMQAKAAELDFDNAMAEAQAAMKTVRKDANNPQTRSKYASFAALDKAIRPIYTKHGFSLSFSTADGAPADCVRIVCKVAHRGGHRERPHLDMPTDGKGAKGADVMTKTHAMGSGIMYGRRYLLNMIFNIATGDDDGNAAGGYQGGRAGSAGGGTDFRPEGRRGFNGRSWTDDDPDLVDHTREKGTMPGKQPAPKAAAPAPAPAKATTPPPLTRAEKIKAGADRRIKVLQDGIEGHPWTRQTLDQFWADETEWHSVIRDEAPKQFERFEQAFLDAKEKL